MSDPKGFIQRWSRRKRAAAEDVGAQNPDAAASVGLGDSGNLSALPLPAGERVGVRGDRPTERPHPLTPALSQREREPAESADGSSAQTQSTADLPFDVTQLPPIESITAETDIRAFLTPGVPPELTRAALRRAWAVDPKIREFVGLSENSWDFNAPGAIAGFGPLEMTDELRRQVAKLVGRNVAPEAAEAPPSTSTEGQERRAAIETSAVSNAGDGNLPAPSPPTSHAEPVNSGAQSPDQYLVCEDNHIATQREPERRDCTERTAKGPHGRALPE